MKAAERDVQEAQKQAKEALARLAQLKQQSNPRSSRVPSGPGVTPGAPKAEKAAEKAAPKFATLKTVLPELINIALEEGDDKAKKMLQQLERLSEGDRNSFYDSYAAFARPDESEEEPRVWAEMNIGTISYDILAEITTSLESAKIG